MLVYRICDKEEIDTIFGERSFENVGGLGSRYAKKQKEKNIKSSVEKNDIILKKD